MPKRSPVKKVVVPESISISWDSKPNLFEKEPCLYCKSTSIPKVFVQGAVIIDDKIIYNYRGMIHDGCISKLHDEKEAEYNG